MSESRILRQPSKNIARELKHGKFDNDEANRSILC